MRARSLAFAAVLAAAAGLPPPAAAQPLTIVNVSAPQINCVFSPTCSVTVSDRVEPLAAGGFLQSRTFQAQAGSPAAGKWVYQYRLDMRRNIASPTPQVTAMYLMFPAPPLAMDFNGDGVATEKVFVITQGAMGSVAPSAAWVKPDALMGDTVVFEFSPALTGTSTSAEGQSTFFFGMVSNCPPQELYAILEGNTGDGYLTAVAPEGSCTGPNGSRARTPESRPGIRRVPDPSPGSTTQPRARRPVNALPRHP